MTIRLTLLLALLLSTITFANDIQSGDSGKSFAENLSKDKCSEPGIADVSVCSGNVVKVTYSSGEGSVFYKPDGKIVICKPAPPTDMGAECVQLLSPNPCFSESVCAIEIPHGLADNTSTDSPSRNETGNRTQNVQLPKTEGSKPQAYAANTAPKMGNGSQSTIAFLTSLSDNSKDLLMIGICGIFASALATVFYIRSLPAKSN